MRDRVIAPNIGDGALRMSNYVAPRINRESGTRERHMPRGNYIGPGTDIVRRINEGIRPTTKTDRGALLHDVSYYNIRSGLRDLTLTVPKAKQAVRRADNILIDTAKKNITNITNPLNVSHAIGALAGMKGKEKLEDLGAIDMLKYVGKGKTKDPFKKLRKTMMTK